MDIMSLAHTKWRCNYHIVFAPKYRRRLIYGELRADIGKIIRNLCARKVCKERSGNYRGKCMCRSYTYAGKNSAETFGICIYGIPERKKFIDNF